MAALALTQVKMRPALTPQTRIGIAINKYARRLVDARLFSRFQREGLLQLQGRIAKLLVRAP
jgi:hypothetical protein